MNPYKPERSVIRATNGDPVFLWTPEILGPELYARLPKPAAYLSEYTALRVLAAVTGEGADAKDQD